MASRMEQRQGRRSKQKLAAREAISWAAWLMAAVVLAIIVRMFFFTLAVVDGSSMETTLKDGEVMGVSVAHYKFSQPKRGDVVVCHFPGDGDYYVKRVIGLPGDTVFVQQRILYVNGQQVLEPYLHEEMFSDFDPVLVPQDSYFVMGDNRNYSRDSRSVGPIAKEDMVGRALFVIWPMDFMRGIEAPDVTQ